MSRYAGFEWTFSRLNSTGTLFLEFGVDGNESSVSEDWPFELHKLLETSNLAVFEFHADQAYFAADEGLNFLPKAGMAVEDLLLQRSGARWIGERSYRFICGATRRSRRASND